MAILITVPRLGWNMEEGVFLGWIKADGEPVRAGEALFTLESDKATEDVEGFDNGILHVPADGPNKGDVVAVGAVIGFLLQEGEPVATKTSGVPQPRKPMAVGTSSPATAATAPRRDRPASSPRARRAAAKLGLDWKVATGTGRTGRIRERDVIAMIAVSLGVPARAGASSTRRVIAERMLTSHRSTAPVTLTTTIDATNLVAFRNRCKVASKSSGDLVPSYTDLRIDRARP